MSEEPLRSEFNCAVAYLSELSDLLRLADDYFIVLSDAYLPVQQKLPAFEKLKTTVRLIAVKIKYFCAERADIERLEKEINEHEQSILQQCAEESMVVSGKHNSDVVHDEAKHLDMVSNSIPERLEKYFEFFTFLHEVAAKNKLLLRLDETFEAPRDFVDNISKPLYKDTPTDILPQDAP